jgi:hypothetical protein
LKCKGFVFTLEAILCAFLILSFLIYLNSLEPQQPNLLDILQKQQNLDKTNMISEFSGFLFENSDLLLKDLQKQHTKSQFHVQNFENSEVIYLQNFPKFDFVKDLF